MEHVRNADDSFIPVIGFFIWIAENITTFFGAWAYPNQETTWSLVHLGKN